MRPHFSQRTLSALAPKALSDAFCYDFCTKMTKTGTAVEEIKEQSAALLDHGAAAPWLSQWQSCLESQQAPCLEVRDDGDGLAHSLSRWVNFNFDNA